jgi:phage tail-like protein
MSDTFINNPILSSTFGFELDGVEIANFTGCSGLSVEFDVTEFQSVSAAGKTILRKIPGRPKYTEVVLKRGLTADQKLNDWFKEITDHATTPTYKTASIVLHDENYKEVARFNLDKCWPSKLSSADLSSGSDDVVIEELTLQHQLLTWG